MNTTNNKNAAVNNSSDCVTKLIVERRFGTLDLMDLYTDYAVNKIIETEKKISVSESAA